MYSKFVNLVLVEVVCETM